jgi:hypothetical protein
MSSIVHTPARRRSLQTRHDSRVDDEKSIAPSYDELAEMEENFRAAIESAQRQLEIADTNVGESRADPVRYA